MTSVTNADEALVAAFRKFYFGMNADPHGDWRLRDAAFGWFLNQTRNPSRAARLSRAVVANYMEGK